jgi:hypothetical protein
MPHRTGVFCVAALLTLVSIGFADSLTLKDGRVVNGTYLGGNARQIRMEVGDNIQTFEIERISSIQFGSAPPVATTAPALAPQRPAEPAPRERVTIFRPDAPSQTATNTSRPGVELTAGTVITVRMIDSVDSEVNRVGETFRASVDEPVTLGSDQVIPRGADVVVKLVDDKQSGKISGRTELTLDLVSIDIDGRSVDINTQAITQASESRTSRSGKVIGGTTALGAVIGAIAGGGKGAAIGAVAGAGAGTAAQVATKGQRVRIPSETRLTFTLEYPVRI